MEAIIYERKGRRNWTGFAFSEGGLVFYNGQWRNHNGQWEMVDTLDDDCMADAIDYLSESDFGHLERLLESEAKKAEDAKRSFEQLVASKLESLSALQEGHRIKVDGRMWMRHNGSVCRAFFKQGGYREHLAPVSIREAEELIRGTKVLRYIKRSNRFILKEAA